GERHDGAQISLLPLAQPEVRVLRLLDAPAIEPRPRLLGRALAPEQALGLIARLPLLRRRAQTGQELRVLLALREPLLELRPPLDERLVHDLHGPSATLVRGLDQEQPRVGKVLDHLLHLAGVLGERPELRQAHDRARALGRAEAQEHRPAETYGVRE